MADVINETELRDAIFAANAGGDTTINITDDVILTESLPMISSNVTIDGGGNLINADTFRAFFIQSGTVTIANVTIVNAGAFGGNGGHGGDSGGGGGGGGLGAGAAVFVNSGAVVTLTNVEVDTATAQGGDGGAGEFSGDDGTGGGGGGGLGGRGGDGGADGAGGGGYAGSGGSSEASKVQFATLNTTLALSAADFLVV